jgi:parallel beta-helix repeat protein
MSKELLFNVGESGLTDVFCCIFKNDAGTIKVNITGGDTWEAPNFAANLDNYDIALTDLGGGNYGADFPSTITTEGIYFGCAYRGVPASNIITHYLRPEKDIHWNGLAEVLPAYVGDEMTLTSAYDAAKTAAQAGDEMNISDGAITSDAFDNSTAFPLVPSPYIWHVAKTGSDSNGGHSFDDAKLTIAAARAASAEGDTIIIHPGDYDESVTARDYQTWLGTNRHSCRIARTGAGEKCFTAANSITIKNLSFSTTSKTSNSYAIYGNGKTNINIENCDIFGAYDGLYLLACNDVTIRHCKVESNYDAINYQGTKRLRAENCSFITDGTFGTEIPVRAICGLFPTEDAIFIHCSMRATKNVVDDLPVYGVCAHNAILIGCQIYCESGASHTGLSYGVAAYLSSTHNAHVILVGCNIDRKSTNGTGYDLSNAPTPEIVEYIDGYFAINNCVYDTTKTTGTITIGSNHTAADVKTAIEAAGSHLTLIKTETDKIASVKTQTDKITDQIIEADEYVDTTTTPWQLVRHKKNDSQTEYSRKDIKTSDDEDVTSATQIPGKLIEPE